MCKICLDLMEGVCVDEDEPSVICVASNGAALTVNRSYDVYGRDWSYKDGSTYYRIFNDLGCVNWYHQRYFKE